MVIKKHIDTYVTQHSAELNLSVHTIKNKTNVFKRLLKFLGDKPLTLETVNEYLADMRSRLSRKRSFLRQTNIAQ
jgi:hypothetical protein